jgi:hypothetical protein
MPIPVTCSQCRRTFKASDSAAGRKAKCPGCGHLIEIPAAPPGASAGPAAPTGHAAAPHPLDAMATALTGAAWPSTALGVDETPDPVPVQPTPVASAAPPLVALPAEEQAGDFASHGDEDEIIITVPPIGVQTPSGLVVGQKRRFRQAVRRHRQIASWARIVGMALGGMCLAMGISGMIYLAITTRTLPSALGVFLLMLVLAAVMVSGGMLARYFLLALADLTEQAAAHQDLLEEINERLS